MPITLPPDPDGMHEHDLNWDIMSARREAHATRERRRIQMWIVKPLILIAGAGAVWFALVWYLLGA